MNSSQHSSFSEAEAYHETKRHSDTMFAYNVYPCTIPQDFSFVPVHWQDSIEIIYVKKGSGIVQVDFDIFTALSGDIFLVLPGHIHGLRGLPGCRMEYENIIFDPAFLDVSVINLCSQKYWRPLLSGQISLPVRIECTHELHDQIAFFLDVSDKMCDQHPDGYELGVKGNLLMVFSLLFRMAIEKEPVNQKNEEKLKQILICVKEKYDQKLTVEDMARTCGYSASHFMRWFKEATGMSFNHYLIEYRLEKAASLLRSTSDTVLEIAEKTGFENLSNFNRLFRKKFGITPSRFRIARSPQETTL